MSDAGPPIASSRARWWPVLLVLSLAANFLVGGMVAAEYFWPERIERFTGTGYTQLLPRKFLGDLSRERRKELLGVLKGYRGRYHADRDKLGDAALRLAAALEAEPYDAAAVKNAVDSFAAAGSEMIGGGSAAALDLISRLDAGERATLARRIAERVRRPR